MFVYMYMDFYKSFLYIETGYPYFIFLGLFFYGLWAWKWSYLKFVVYFVGSASQCNETETQSQSNSASTLPWLNTIWKLSLILLLNIQCPENKP